MKFNLSSFLLFSVVAVTNNLFNQQGTVVVEATTTTLKEHEGVKLSKGLRGTTTIQRSTDIVESAEKHHYGGRPLLRKLELDYDGDSDSDSDSDGLFEGDIVPDYDMIMANYGPEMVKELEEEGILDPSADNAAAAAATTENIVTNRRWPTRVNDIVEVPYVIETNSYQPYQVTKIKDAIEELADRSKVVKFVPRSYQTDYLVVRPGNGCSSFVGKSGGQQQISLQSYCVNRKGTIQHEFMHALGIFHEQSRPDRDNYVKINYQNIGDGRDHNFAKKTNTQILGNDYDYGSVMHYSKSAFTSNGKDTITPIGSTNGADIGQRFEADDQDIIDIQLLYQCKSGPRSLPQYNSNRCTVDCKCWADEVGCNGNNNACQGSLTCSNNKCVVGLGGGTGGGGTGGGGSGTGGGGGPPRRTMSPTASPRGNGRCVDSPARWHDSDGAIFNCQWYAVENRCAKYGNSYGNFGKTAKQACCACGGGSRNDDSRGSRDASDSTTNVIKIGNNCLGVNETDNHNAVVWRCSLEDNYQQSWSYYENTKELKNIHNGLCLNWSQNDNNVIVHQCNGEKNQKWYIDETENGTVTMIRVADATGKCLALDPNKKNVLVEEKCYFALRQQFQLE